MQNLVLLMEPSEMADAIHFKGGNMCLNRFSIDEEAAFEISGVHYLETLSYDKCYPMRGEVERKPKGKGYLIII